MRLAYILTQPLHADRDQFLYRVALSLLEKGFRPCGAVQANLEAPRDQRCDMVVKLLPNGPHVQISQNLGPAASGCRLDPDALEQVVALTEAALAHRHDALIINKFGKHEAEGRGFRNAIAMAMERDIPVIVSVNQLNLAAFKAFAGGLAVRLPLDEAAVISWLERSHAPMIS